MVYLELKVQIRINPKCYEINTIPQKMKCTSLYFLLIVIIVFKSLLRLYKGLLIKAFALFSCECDEVANYACFVYKIIFFSSKTAAV